MHGFSHALCLRQRFSLTLSVILLKSERLASDLIELSTRQNFASWLAGGAIHRGWARSASGDTAEGILVDRAGNKRHGGQPVRCWSLPVFAGD